MFGVLERADRSRQCCGGHDHWHWGLSLVEVRPSEGRTAGRVQCWWRDRFSPKVQFNSDTSNSFAESLELEQGVLPRGEWRVASCPLFVPIPKNVQSNSLGIKQLWRQRVQSNQYFKHLCYSRCSFVHVVTRRVRLEYWCDVEGWCCICDGETAHRWSAARQSINIGQVCCVSSSDRWVYRWSCFTLFTSFNLLTFFPTKLFTFHTFWKKLFFFALLCSFFPLSSSFFTPCVDLLYILLYALFTPFFIPFASSPFASFLLPFHSLTPLLLPFAFTVPLLYCTSTVPFTVLPLNLLLSLLLSVLLYLQLHLSVYLNWTSPLRLHWTFTGPFFTFFHFSLSKTFSFFIVTLFSPFYSFYRSVLQFSTLFCFFPCKKCKCSSIFTILKHMFNSFKKTFFTKKKQPFSKLCIYSLFNLSTCDFEIFTFFVWPLLFLTFLKLYQTFLAHSNILTSFTFSPFEKFQLSFFWKGTLRKLAESL